MREEQIDKLQKRYRNKLPQFLEALAKGKQFKKALETPLGGELLQDIIDSLKDRIVLVVEEQDTKETRAEIRALREIIRKWTKKINEANHIQNEFNEVTKDG